MKRENASPSPRLAAGRNGLVPKPSHVDFAVAFSSMQPIGFCKQGGCRLFKTIVQIGFPVAWGQGASSRTPFRKCQGLNAVSQIDPPKALTFRRLQGPQGPLKGAGPQMPMGFPFSGKRICLQWSSHVKDRSTNPQISAMKGLKQAVWRRSVFPGAGLFEDSRWGIEANLTTQSNWCRTCAGHIVELLLLGTLNKSKMFPIQSFRTHIY